MTPNDALYSLRERERDLDLDLDLNLFRARVSISHQWGGDKYRGETRCRQITYFIVNIPVGWRGFVIRLVVFPCGGNS